MDKIDHAILSELSRDGRLSFRELATKVHLSPNAVAERYRRLRANGTIRRVRAELDPAALGRVIEAIVEVKLASGTSAATFETALRHLPQLVSVMLVTGSFDYAVRVACVDRDDLVAVTETLRRHGVQDTHTRLILRELQFN